MEILRYAAFTTIPTGGNPAGVVLDATGATDAEMQRIATDLGYSETAFLVPTGPYTATVRYFAPAAEVPFCGHATIAAAVARAERFGIGPLTLDSVAGPISVTTVARRQRVSIAGEAEERNERGAEQSDTAPAHEPDAIEATLVSVPPTVTEMPDHVIARLLHALRLTDDDLDPELPIRVAYTGNAHPIVPVSPLALDTLDDDTAMLRPLMAEMGWRATVAVVTRLVATEFEARNPFPPGGVREDPATGSAAAALGAYLRALEILTPPARITVRQGRHIGRPGELIVDIPPGTGGIAVSGRAVPIA